MAGYVVVAEIGLTKNRYGADIAVTEPMPAAEAQEYLDKTAAGSVPEFYELPRDARVLRQSPTQYLILESHKVQPDRLTRLSVAEQVN